MLSTIGSDLNYAMRRLWARPAHAAVVILILALAIGANTAVFSALYGLPLKPLPYPESDQLNVLNFPFSKVAPRVPRWVIVG
jgi:putative ABC transport system permease protein